VEKKIDCGCPYYDCLDLNLALRKLFRLSFTSYCSFPYVNLMSAWLFFWFSIKILPIYIYAEYTLHANGDRGIRNRIPEEIHEFKINTDSLR